MIGIYKITSPTGRIYIGQSWNIDNRWKDYENTSSVKHQRKLYNSLRKHGKLSHTFEIVAELPVDISQEVLNNYEFLYLELYKSCGIDSMNLKEAGSNGRHSRESINLMKVIRKNYHETNPEQRLRMQKSITQFLLSGEFIKDWDSITEACYFLRISRSALRDNLKARRKSKIEFIFKYKC